MRYAEFDFRLTGPGWCEARLQIDEQWVALSASYLGDALGELVRATLAIVTHENGEEGVSVHWEEEPGEYRWTLRPIGEDLDVQVLWFDDHDDESPQEKLRGTCSRSVFCAAIAKGARAALARYGFDGYKSNWHAHDFPLETLEQLEALT
ncbi:hypothetical protein BH11ACT8_BH11ACT8_23200 [soil metagenome]